MLRDELLELLERLDDELLLELIDELLDDELLLELSSTSLRPIR